MPLSECERDLSAPAFPTRVRQGHSSGCPLVSKRGLRLPSFASQRTYRADLLGTLCLVVTDIARRGRAVYIFGRLNWLENNGRGHVTPRTIYAAASSSVLGIVWGKSD